jgi:hypothetical protein
MRFVICESLRVRWSRPADFALTLMRVALTATIVARVTRPDRCRICRMPLVQNTYRRSVRRAEGRIPTTWVRPISSAETKILDVSLS